MTASSTAKSLRTPFSIRERAQLFKTAAQEIMDVVIVGGGVTGAAIARDAALRGLKVALFESHDFASGTSSGSTKLLHGGLRYLEMYDFKLVFEAIQERELLKSLYAPLVKDLRFVFPTYEGRYPPRWKLNLGLHLYDGFSYFKQRHQNLTRAKAITRFPELTAEGLTGACIYTDSFAEDFRLTVELIHSAFRYGAICLNQAEVTNFRDLSPAGDTRTNPDALHEVRVRDRLSAQEFTVRTRTVVNATGPFSDQLREKFNLKKRLRLTQGIHLIVPRTKLPINEAYVCSDPELNRILFAIPWGEITYLGTTDTSIADPKLARTSAEDVDYVLKEISPYFRVKLARSDVIQSWAAVRPLLEPDASAANSQVSREHTIVEEPQRIFHIMGGKLTSHRLMAEEILDQVVKYFSHARKCSTAKRALFESSNERTLAIAALDQQLKLGGKKVFVDYPLTKAEVLFAIHHEMALEPLDFIRRRSSLYYERPTAVVAQAITDIFAEELEWTPEAKKQQLQNVLKSYEWDHHF